MSEHSNHLVILLPWLRLKKQHRVAGVEFCPFRDESGRAHPVFRGAVTSITTILSSYRAVDGKRLSKCTVATVADRGWDLEDSDLEQVRWAASLLFLAAWACNEYFPNFFGAYVNSTAFRVVAQRFLGPKPVGIAIVSRRRDGRVWEGGYNHGEAKFSRPMQCGTSDAAIDETFLGSLDAADTAHARSIEGLRLALPFVLLANTDDDVMTPSAEAILMASAFEQLLAGPSRAYGLGKKFGVLLKQCGSVTLEEAKKVRPGIEIDTSRPDWAAAQRKWWVHRKWLEELYDVRSKAAHKGHHDDRFWGWNLQEYLVMAAFAFPLTVKLLLERDGQYTFSEDDRVRCLALDKVLATTGWHERTQAGPRLPRWSSILSDVASAHQDEKVLEELKKEHPEWFPDDSSPVSSEE